MIVVFIPAVLHSKVHTPETPVGNKDNLFLDGIREREEIAEIIF